MLRFVAQSWQPMQKLMGAGCRPKRLHHLGLHSPVVNHFMNSESKMNMSPSYMPWTAVAPKMDESVFFKVSPSQFNVASFDFPSLVEDDRCEIYDPNSALNDPMLAIKRTYQPSSLRRKRKHGFLKRKSTATGRRILKSRMKNNRKRLSA